MKCCIDAIQKFMIPSIPRFMMAVFDHEMDALPLIVESLYENQTSNIPLRIVQMLAFLPSMYLTTQQKDFICELLLGFDVSSQKLDSETQLIVRSALSKFLDYRKDKLNGFDRLELLMFFIKTKSHHDEEYGMATLSIFRIIAT